MDGAVEDRIGGDCPAAEPIRLVLADDHELFRQGLVALLEEEPDLIVVGQAGTGGSAIETAVDMRPDVLVLDLGLPDMHGSEAARLVGERAPDVKIVVLSASVNSAQATVLARLGVRAYVDKMVSAQDLAEVLRAVRRGEVRFDPSVAAVLVGGPITPEAPTERELEVLRLVGQGLRTREVAETLVMSERTVHFHLRNLFRKLGVSSRLGLVREAREKGWVA